MTDPLTYLDEVDARHESAFRGPFGEQGALSHARQDLPALSKALRTVLSRHAPGEVGCPHPTHKCNDPDYRGLLCADAGPECEAGCGWWPCIDVQAIQAALAVNDEGGKK